MVKLTCSIPQPIYTLLAESLSAITSSVKGNASLDLSVHLPHAGRNGIPTRRPGADSGHRPTGDAPSKAEATSGRVWFRKTHQGWYLGHSRCSGHMFI